MWQAGISLNEQLWLDDLVGAVEALVVAVVVAAAEGHSHLQENNYRDVNQRPFLRLWPFQRFRAFILIVRSRVPQLLDSFLVHLLLESQPYLQDWVEFGLLFCRS